MKPLLAGSQTVVELLLDESKEALEVQCECFSTVSLLCYC